MRFKYLRDSEVFYEGKTYNAEIWQEIKSKKIRIVDKETKKHITFNGAMGEEI